MNFTELQIKNCYESGVDNIIEDFYEPVLSLSVKYDRIAGFFSSSSLAIASRGMANFIRNGGKMRLICSPVLNEPDADIIKKIYDSHDVTLSKYLGINLNSIEDEFESNHVKALGWMLANELLEIKLAILKDERGLICTADDLSKKGIFHQKVGIMHDACGNSLSFSGSINESATAWVNNDEEFKVFKQWAGMEEYYAKDKNRFDAIWDNQRKNVQSFDLPTAIKQELIDYSKDFDIESISIKKYIQKKLQNELLSKISLFPYQYEALLQWKKHGYNMLFEMATGTGKTRTAITGLDHLMSMHEKLFVVIACPQNTLSVQWMGELEKLNIKGDINEIIDGTNAKWQSILGSILSQNSAGFANQCIIYTTHKTASSLKFIETIRQKRNKRVKMLFIGDEVHWLGASQYRKALLEDYDYRIGLSATPSRWFDDDGTKMLESYFGDNHFEFTIKDALFNVNPLTGKHFLVNYYYYINHVRLNELETEQYKKLTARIIALISSKNKNIEDEQKYERLIEQRADIIKNAENKYDVFESILDKLKAENNINNLIVFVSPQQMDRVKEILVSKNVIFHKLTQEEGTIKQARYNNKSEREYIIQQFKTGNYQVLVAIKCLDEGIDIPSASRGILMASSTNPREYVQRIGRIIRQDSNKQFAYLYDICVDSIEGDNECANIERKIRNKEQVRMKEIAENAINSVDALEHILQFN